MAKGNHSFTEQDIRKRFGAIVGHTVAEVDTADVLAASKASRNKGRIGAVIEQSVLGYPADSDSRPDILIDGQPWEVKATGLKEGARGGWCAKEPMSITAVAPEGIVTESFSTSAFWHKAGLVFKTMTLTPTGGRTEDMKLNPSIDFDELCDPSVEFEDSAFAAPFIDSTMVVAVLEERYRDCPLCQCIFMGFKTLWLGTYLDAARALWDGMRDLIFSDGLVDAPVLKKDGTPRVTPKTGIPMTAPNWPKSRDGVLFVRGTGTDANDKPVTVNGVRMYRQNVWIKGKELVGQLDAVRFL